VSDIYPPARQRKALVRLVQALGSWDRALQRDECGDPRLIGKYGHIYAVLGTLDRPHVEGFQIYFRGAEEFEEPPPKSTAWAHAKKAMAFTTATHDGDAEGVLFLDRLPTAAEAEIIRHKLGIRKRVEYDEETLARKRAAMQMARAVTAPKSTFVVGPAAFPTTDPTEGEPRSKSAGAAS
jgi:hypothetical protein